MHAYVEPVPGTGMTIYQRRRARRQCSHGLCPRKAAEDRTKCARHLRADRERIAQRRAGLHPSSCSRCLDRGCERCARRAHDHMTLVAGGLR